MASLTVECRILEDKIAEQYRKIEQLKIRIARLEIALDKALFRRDITKDVQN